MIPFDFIYIKPKTVEEAFEAFNLYNNKGLKPLYYAGGTEIVTFMRKNRIKADVLIDLKSIDRCIEIKNGDKIYIGAAVPLNSIIDSNVFDLLSEVSKHIADHTVRNRLSIGGNIAGMLPYREGILPLLVIDAELSIMGSSGIRSVSINKVFSKRIKLERGEFIVGISIKKETTLKPWYFNRKERFNRVDYPIVSVVVIKEKNSYKIATSGTFNFPVKFENIFSNEDFDKILYSPNVKFKNDFRASAEYRRFLFKEMIDEAFKSLGGFQ